MNRRGFVGSILMACIAACGGESPLDPPDVSSKADIFFVGPFGLVATAVSVAEIDLAWRQGPAQVNGFQIYRSTTASGTYTLLASVAASARSNADRALADSTEYCYQVRSWQTTPKVTTYSSFAGPACATTFTPPPPPIAAPSAVSAVPTREEYPAPYSAVDLAWTDNSSNEDGFRIERASSVAGPWTQMTTVPANATAARWDIDREQQVCFRLKAFNVSSTSNASAPACTTAPANPTNLVALPTDQGIDLAWSDISAVEDGYKVSRTDGSGAWTDLARLPADATSYSDAAASPDVTYVYRVQALKDGGVSDYSNQAVGVRASSRPAAPTDLAAMWWADQEGYGWLYFNAWWTDASANEQGFRLEGSPDGISGWATDTIAPGGAPQLFAKYDLFAVAGAAFSVCYRVIAFNAAGDSEPSNVFCTGWAESPTDVVATVVDANSVDLAWTDNARFESGYWVARLRLSDSVWESVGAFPANATSCHDTGLQSGQEYWYVVSVAYPQNWNADYFNYGGVSVTMP